jgi:hypothetical protein
MLKSWAYASLQVGATLREGSDYAYLYPAGRGWPDGELQVFTDYRRRLGAAAVARREVLAERPRPLAPGDLNPLIWAHTRVVRDRRIRRVTSGAV